MMALLGYGFQHGSGPVTHGGRTMSGSATSATTLPCDRSAPRLARRWVAEQLNPLGLERHRHDGAVLLVSELVSDAVLAHHAPVVTLHIAADEIVLGVEDADGDGDGDSGVDEEPDAVESEALRAAIVDEFADEWGERYEPDGTHVVWFSILNAA